MSNKIWRYSAGKRGESPAISGAAGPVTAIIDFTRIVGDEGRVLRAVRAGLIVAGASAGSILGGPSNRSRTLVGGLSLVKKDRALELGWVEIKPRPRDSCQEESPSAEHQLRSNGPGDQRPAACIENVENQCSPKKRCQWERERAAADEGGQGLGYLLPPGEGAAQRRMRGAGPRPVPPLTRPSARPRKRGSPRSRRQRDRAAADEGHSCRRDCSLIRLQGLRSHLMAAEYLGDSFNNSLQAMEDLVIGDSDHPQPNALEPGFPATITGPSVGMAVAVNLQNQTRGMTVEVHDVRSDHHLPTKLPTRQATVAESLPD